MLAAPTYLFTSERLGFRDWRESDLEAMYAINTDEEVMKYFPALKTREETLELITRMRAQLAEKGFCYFAVDTLVNNEFIGFIGLTEQNLAVSFAPYTDIGWRLKRTAWNKGFATEGAQRCLQYGFRHLGLETIKAIAPKINLASTRVMEKIGMRKVMEFKHPLLSASPQLEDCVLFEAWNFR